MSNQTVIDTNQTLETSKLKRSDISDIMNYPQTQRKKESSILNIIPKNLEGIKNMVTVIYIVTNSKGIIQRRIQQIQM